MNHGPLKRKRRRETVIFDLPIEMLGKVASYLPLFQITVLRRVCRWFNWNIKRLPIWWPSRCEEGTPYDEFRRHFIPTPEALRDSSLESLSPFLKALVLAYTPPTMKLVSDDFEFRLLADPPTGFDQVVLITFKCEDTLQTYLVGSHRSLAHLCCRPVSCGSNLPVLLREEELQIGLRFLATNSNQPSISRVLKEYCDDMAFLLLPPKVVKLGEDHYRIQLDNFLERFPLFRR